MAYVTIDINMDRKCAECRKVGSLPSGLCLGCIAKALDPKRKMKSELGRAAQEKLKRQFAAQERKENAHA